MSQIVYVSLRNTLIGKGNFGRPLLLDTVLSEHSPKELFDMGMEGDVSFFDEDGDTIVLEDAVVQLKMMINVGAANVEETSEMLMLYHREDLELIENLQFKLKRMKNVNLTAKSIKFDDIETIHTLIVDAKHVVMLINSHMDQALCSMLMAFMISKQNDKNVLLINASNKPLRLDKEKILHDLIAASREYNESSFVGKRFQRLVEEGADLVIAFQNLSTVNYRDIENLKFYL